MEGELMFLHADLNRGGVEVAQFDDRSLGCPETPLS